MPENHTINPLDPIAIAATIPGLRAVGNWVISRYQGPDFVGCDSHPDEQSAISAMERLTLDNYPGERMQLLAPTNAVGKPEVDVTINSSGQTVVVDDSPSFFTAATSTVDIAPAAIETVAVVADEAPATDAAQIKSAI
jgi:hypothetical protein